MWKFGFLIFAGFFILGGSDRSVAAEDPVFRLEFEDGKITPLKLEVPARTRFKIEIYNKGKTAAEFEMEKPHKEKVLAPGAQSSIVFKTLDPGEYEFIDEFHPEAPKGVIIAK